MRVVTPGWRAIGPNTCSNGAVPQPDDPSNDETQEPSMWDRLGALPDMDSAPLDAPWLPGGVGPEQPTSADSTKAEPSPMPSPAGPAAPQEPRDQRRFTVSAPPPVSRAPQHRPPAPAQPLPQTEPGHQETAPERSSRPRRARTALRLFATFVAVVLLGILGGTLYGWYLWSSVDKVDTENSLASADTFTNYLIVGVDSREGVDPALGPQVGLRAGNNLSDTMLVLHVSDADDVLVSLPRDLWLPIDGGAAAKLNSAAALGAPSLIRTVDRELGVPVHHYLEVDIAGFLDVIEAMGTITITFDAPACDPKSKLDIRQTGEVELSAAEALAYVRARTYTTFDAAAAEGLTCEQIRAAGLGSTQGNADFGRTERQRIFLNATFAKLSATRNPFTLLRVGSGLRAGLRVDDSMGFFDALALFRDLRGMNAEPLGVPVSDFNAPGGASALVLNSESDNVLDLLRTD